jgi:pyruvate formate lyase activating enzyme
VVISGGEPTLDPVLPDFLAALKNLGLAVKLDTNGLCPEILSALLDRRLLDYLAIDLKTVPARYPELHPGPVHPADLLASIRLALTAPIAVEFRTTCIPGLVDAPVIGELGELIRGAPLWALQQYHPAAALAPAWQELVPYPAPGIAQLADIARQYVGAVAVRGIG